MSPAGAAREDPRQDVPVGRLQRRRGRDRELDLTGSVFGGDLRDRQTGLIEVPVYVVHEGDMLEQRGEAIGRTTAPGNAPRRGVEGDELDLRGRENLESLGLGCRLLPAQRAARAERE